MASNLLICFNEKCWPQYVLFWFLSLIWSPGMNGYLHSNENLASETHEKVRRIFLLSVFTTSTKSRVHCLPSDEIISNLLNSLFSFFCLCLKSFMSGFWFYDWNKSKGTLEIYTLNINDHNFVSACLL